MDPFSRFQRDSKMKDGPPAPPPPSPRKVRSGADTSVAHEPSRTFSTLWDRAIVKTTCSGRVRRDIPCRGTSNSLRPVTSSHNETRSGIEARTSPNLSPPLPSTSRRSLRFPTRPSTPRVVLPPLLILLVASSTAAGESCGKARNLCMSNNGCAMALHNYMTLCSDLIYGSSNTCSDLCKKALLSLASTDYGWKLINCNCTMDNPFCLEQRERMEVCSHVLDQLATVLDSESTVSCTLAEWICTADSTCLVALEYYQRNCVRLVNGVACTSYCNNSINILKRQQKSKKLWSCECDGTEDYNCPELKQNLATLCYPPPPTPSTRSPPPSISSKPGTGSGNEPPGCGATSTSPSLTLSLFVVVVALLLVGAGPRGIPEEPWRRKRRPMRDPEFVEKDRRDDDDNSFDDVRWTSDVDLSDSIMISASASKDDADDSRQFTHADRQSPNVDRQSADPLHFEVECRPTVSPVMRLTVRHSARPSPNFDRSNSSSLTSVSSTSSPRPRDASRLDCYLTALATETPLVRLASKTRPEAATALHLPSSTSAIPAPRSPPGRCVTAFGRRQTDFPKLSPDFNLPTSSSAPLTLLTNLVSPS